MNETQFRQELQAEGYTEAVEVTWAAGKTNDSHAHDFSAKGLVVEGLAIITSADGEQRCGVGDTFVMAAGTAHTEAVGAQGAKLLVGRK